MTHDGMARPLGSRRRIVVAIAGFVVCAPLTVVLGSLALGGLLGETGNNLDYAVSNEQGSYVLHIKPCDGQVLGRVTVIEGDSPDTPAIVTVAKSSGPGLLAVALDASTPGYDRSGPDLDPTTTYAVEDLTGANGTSLNATVLPFQLDQIAPGQVISNAHGQMSLEAWLAGKPRCH